MRRIAELIQAEGWTGAAYPAGAAADRIGARTLLLYGLALPIAADVVLALAATPWFVFLGAALLPASVIAGALWSAFGAPATFAAGALFAALGLSVAARRGRAGVVQ